MGSMNKPSTTPPEDVLGIMRRLDPHQASSMSEAIVKLGQKELTLTNPSPTVDDNFWDNWFTIVIQGLMGQYHTDSFSEIINSVALPLFDEAEISADGPTAPDSANSVEEPPNHKEQTKITSKLREELEQPSMTKFQIQLEILYNECVRTHPINLSSLGIHSPDGKTIEEKFPPECLRLLEFLKSNNVGINCFAFDWRTGSLNPVFVNKSTTFLSAPEPKSEFNLIFTFDTEVHLIRSVIHKRSLAKGLKEYCDNILMAAIERQEMTTHIRDKFTKIPTEELHDYISSQLKLLAGVSTLSGFVKQMFPPLETSPESESKANLDNLRLLEKYETELLTQENLDSEQLLQELKTCYTHSVLRASQEALEARMADHREESLRLQKKEEELLIENDRLESLIEAAEKAKKEKEEKIAKLEKELLNANAEKKAILQAEIAQLKKLDESKALLLKHKEEFSWNLFKKEVIAVEVSYDNLVKSQSWRNSLKASPNLRKQCEELLKIFRFPALSPESRNLLMDYCVKNDTPANRDELGKILDIVFQPPSISYNPKNNNILEVKGRQILASDMISRISKYKFTELRILAGSVFYLDANFTNGTFHSKNVAICSPKVQVIREAVIDTSGLHGTPIGIPGRATSGQEPGRSGFDGAHGAAGEPGGHVYIQANTIINGSSLSITANGGNGGQGQDGGNAQNGKDGWDGRDGNLEDQNWWTSRVCYKITPGQDGQQGQRGGTGGSGGLGGCGGSSGEIFVLPQNAVTKISSVPGSQGRDGSNGSGGRGGTGGRLGVDAGVAWHNYKFAGGEFRYARGKLSVRKQKVWYGGNGYELIIHRNEWDVRNSRARNGEQGLNGVHRSNQRQRAQTKSSIDKKDVSQQFNTVLNQYGQLTKDQSSLVAKLGSQLDQRTQGVGKDQSQYNLDKAARDKLNAQKDATIANKTKDLDSTTQQKQKLEKDLSGLNQNLKETTQDLSQTQEFRREEEMAALTAIKNEQRHLQQIAALVAQHQREQAALRLEALAASQHQQNVVGDYNPAGQGLTSKGSLAPEKVKQAAPDEVKQREELQQERALLEASKLDAKVSHWIRSNPGAWTKIVKSVSKSGPIPKNAIEFSNFLSQTGNYPGLASIEKTMSTLDKLRLSNEPWIRTAEVRLILHHVDAILHSHLEKWFVRECTALNVEHEAVEKMNDLLEAVNEIISEAQQLFDPTMTHLSAYKTFLTIVKDIAKYLGQTGDTLWEAFTVQLSGLGVSSIWYKNKKSVEDILQEHLDNLLLTLQGMPDLKLRKLPEVRANSVLLLKKLVFILPYVEADKSSPTEQKEQLRRISNLQIRVTELLASVPTGEVDLYNNVVKLQEELYANYVLNFQRDEITLVSDSIDEIQGTGRIKALIATEVNHIVSNVESPFSSFTLSDRIKLYGAMRENISKQAEIRSDNIDEIRGILVHGIKTGKPIAKLGSGGKNGEEIASRVQVLLYEFTAYFDSNNKTKAKNATTTSRLSDVNQSNESLKRICYDLAQLEEFPAEALSRINTNISDFYYKLHNNSTQFPTLLSKTLRELQSLLTKFWFQVVDAGFQAVLDQHEGRMKAIDTSITTMLAAIEDYLSASESILFQQEFTECVKIHLIKLVHRILVLEFSGSGHNQLYPQELISAISTKAENIMKSCKTVGEFVPEFCHVLNDCTKLVCQTIIKHSQSFSTLQISSTLQKVLDDPYNCTGILEAAKVIMAKFAQDLDVDTCTTCLREIITLVKFNVRIPAELFQIQVQNQAKISQTPEQPSPQEIFQSLLQFLESSGNDHPTIRDSTDDLRSLLSTVFTHDNRMFGRIISISLQEQSDLRLASIREGQTHVFTTLGRIFDIFHRNPDTVLTYAEPIQNFAHQITRLVSNIAPGSEITSKIDAIFVESCVKFFGLRSIPSLPSPVRAQVWNLFTQNTKLGNILPIIRDQIGPTVEEDEFGWILPLLSILREFIRQLPSSFPTTCQEIGDVVNQLLETNTLLTDYLGEKSPQFRQDCFTPLLREMINLSRRVCIHGLKIKYGALEEEFDKAVQFMNQAEYAFWVLHSRDEKEFGRMTQVFTAMTKDSYNSDVDSIFLTWINSAHPRNSKYQGGVPVDCKSAFNLQGGEFDEGNPVWIKSALATFLLSNTITLREQSLCDRLFMGELTLTPEFSKKSAVTYLLQNLGKLHENRISTALLTNMEPGDSNFTFLNYEEQSLVNLLLKVTTSQEGEELVAKVRNLLATHSSQDWEEQLQFLYMDAQFKNISQLFAANIFSQGRSQLPGKEAEARDAFAKILSKFQSSHFVNEGENGALLKTGLLFNPLLSENIEELIRLKHLFNHVYLFSDNKSLLNTWFEQVQGNLGTREIHLTELNDLLLRSVDIPPNALVEIGQSENWIEGLLLLILTTNVQLYLDKCLSAGSDTAQTLTREEDIDTEAMTKLIHGLGSGFLKNRLLAILGDKVGEEIEFISAATAAKGRTPLVAIFRQVEKCGKILSERLIETLKSKSMTRWPITFREFTLLTKYSKEITSAILNFEACFGPGLCDQLLQTLQFHVKEEEMLIILTHFTRMQWHFDAELMKRLTLTVQQAGGDTGQSPFPSIKSLCEEYTKTYQKRVRDAKEISTVMRADPGNAGMLEKYLQKPPTQENAKTSSSGVLADEPCQLEKLVQEAKSFGQKKSSIAPKISSVINSWTQKDIDTWVHAIKSASNPEKMATAQSSTAEMIAVTSHALLLLKGYPPRDTQLISIILLLDHSFQGKSSLAEVATGEGKTIILAIVVTIRALCGDDVDIITSSPVLAKDNLEEVRAFYAMFGVSSAVNCDEECEKEEKVRRERYQNQVIYGDVGSFQRDILLTEYFNKNITMNRGADIVFVDEVDSMLLDKGENVLYLSHSIPELKYLWPLVIEIWQAVHAPDVAAGTEQDVLLTVRFVQRRIEEGEILVPNCVLKFVLGRLIHWVRNAFLAKRIQEKDSYIVANLDKKGSKVVIMDKDTGVEQVNMQWSNGLHQYIQLKHSDKLGVESLKAVFMSNISYMQRFRGRLFGITGTLGSKVEQDLLEHCYSVEFFKIPRFKARRCYELEGIVAPDLQNWEEEIKAGVQNMVNLSRAVLVICENVDMVTKIGAKLKQVFPRDKVYSYDSSFDKDFIRRKKAGPLTSGDIIVATNIAGRGTDLGVDKDLNKAGGLHVILSYMPPNVRIEEQAFGRTARAGANGTVQYVINASMILATQEDQQAGSAARAITLDDCKRERDGREGDRLSQFRIKSIPRIECEEALSVRFGSLLKTIKLQLTQSGKDWPESLVDLHIKNLQNRWAFWLDSMTEKIRLSHSQKGGSVFSAFDSFEQEMLIACKNLLVGSDSSQGFESGPVESTKLGRHFEEAEKDGEAMSHFNRAIEKDPHFSEVAHYYMAACIIKQTDSGLASKRRAIQHLKIADKLIKKRMNALFASSQSLQLVDDMRRAMGEGTTANRYEEQVKNEAELLKVHLGKISDAIGSQLDGSFFKNVKHVLDEAEGKEIFDVLLRHENILKHYRFSRKIVLNQTLPSKDRVKLPKPELNNELYSVGWPHTLEYCQEEVLNFVHQKMHGNGGRGVKTEDLEGLVLTKERFWGLMKQAGFINEEVQSTVQIIEYKANQKDYESAEFPKELLDFKSVIAKMLEDMDKAEFQTEFLAAFDLSQEQREAVQKILRDTKVVQDKTVKRAQISSQLTYNNASKSWTGFPPQLAKYSQLLAVIIEVPSESGETTHTTEIALDEIPLPETATEAAAQLWGFMLDSGMIKAPKLNFALHNSESQSKVDARFDEIEAALKGSTSELENILKKYHPEKESRPSIDDIMEIMRHAAGTIKKIPKIEITYQELSEYFKTGLYPPEIEEFRENMFFHVFECTEKKSWWDWNAFIVAMLGVAQIIAGVLLEVFTAGAATHFAMALISEGIGDIAFAIQAGLSKNFTWKDYGIHKAISVAISIATAGLGAYLARGAQVAKFGTKAGFQLFRAVGGRMLRKLGEAVAFTLVDFGVEKLLDSIRAEIISGCRADLSKSVESRADGQYKTLEAAMDTLFEASYEDGQAQRLIRDAFASVLSDVKGSNVGTEIYSKASKFTSELASHLGNTSDKLFSHGGKQAEKMNLGGGSSAAAKAAKLAKIAKYIGIILKTASIAKALIEMGKYSEEILTNLVRKIKSIAVTLKQQNKNRGATFQKNHSEFAQFKHQFRGEVKIDIIDYIMSQIQGSMLQPAFEHLTHAALRKAGNAIAERTSNLLKHIGRDRNIQVLRDYRRMNARDDGQIQQILQGRVYHEDLNPDTELTVRAPGSKDGIGITLQDAKSLYGDNIELYQDKKGNLFFKQPAFEQCVEGFGGGKTAGLMELMNCAKFMKANIKIEDLSGDLKTDSGDGFTHIKGRGGKGDGPELELVYTKNSDAVGHFQPKINGVVIDLPQTPGDRNTCLYQSLQLLQSIKDRNLDTKAEGFTIPAELLNASSAQFLAQAKTYASQSSSMKLMYQKGLYDMAAKFRAGMPTTRTLTKEEVDNLKLSQSSVGKQTSEGMSLEDLKTSMAKFGWEDNKPIDVVQMGPGVLTSLDNRRVVAAKVAGPVDVKATIWERDEIMPPSQAKRYGPKTKTAGQAVVNRMRKGSLDESNCTGFSSMDGIPHNKVRIRSRYHEGLESFREYGFQVSNVARKEYAGAGGQGGGQGQGGWQRGRKDARNKNKFVSEE